MDSTITIREYELEDIKEMAELGEMMHKEGAYSFLPYSKSKCRELGKKFKNWDYGNMWVAESDGKIVGMYIAVITEYYFCYEKLAQDMLLYVHPDHRKGTIAIRLVKKAEEWAKERGARQFMSATSLTRSPEQISKLKKFFNFMKYETVGNIFKKRLD